MIKVLSTGSHSCIVDQGRFGYGRYGVPISGAMDRHSAGCANSLVHNDVHHAVIECYLAGVRLEFLEETAIAITGASGHVSINDLTIHINQKIKIKKGDTLQLGRLTKGCRRYIAVAGGIDAPSLLGSSSPLAGHMTSTLEKGQIIPCSHQDTHHQHSHLRPLIINESARLCCYKGPEHHLLTLSQQKALVNNIYTIDTLSNRMGYRLNGPSMEISKTDIPSSAVLPGTIQILPNGLPLALMRDCQVTGGYLRALQLTEASLHQLAQRRPGKTIIFTLT